jgi:hypothetical protein
VYPKKSIQEVSVGQYVQILLVCGILETSLILVQRNPEILALLYATMELAILE